MKYHETSFEDYLNSVEEINFHEKASNLINYQTPEFKDLQNIIFYGDNGIGKYSQVLLFLKKFSLTQLKYEKKMVININKIDLFYKISDIHYEIDMSLLGCNSKLCWDGIFQQIIDIISVKKDNNGFIVCKNFQKIQIELLEIFYSYMQRVCYEPINIKFILITEDICFIPENILNNCLLFSLSKPTKNIIKKKFSKVKHTNCSNLKQLYCIQSEEQHEYEIFDDIIELIKNYSTTKFSTIREKMYNILVYNIDINIFIWYALDKLIKADLIKEEKLQLIIEEIYKIIYYYNNNYRPIYHLEKIIVILIIHIHEQRTSNKNIKNK